MVDFEKLINNIKIKKSADNQINVRKLLEIVASKNNSSQDVEFIKSIGSTVFIQAYLELNKPINDMKIISDMTLCEYAKDNIKNAAVYDNGDDIY